MRRLIISEQDGLFKAETSDGRRTSGASLKSAVGKLMPELLDDFSGLRVVFEEIKPVHSSSQIAHGQASG